MDAENITDSVINATTQSGIRFTEDWCMPRPAKTSDFWKRWMKAREDAGLPEATQAQIAKELDGHVSHQSAVTNWKTGPKLPQIKTVIEMARIAKTSVDWLLTNEIHDFSQPKDDPILKELMTFWKKLTPDSKGHVLHQAKMARMMQTTVAPERVKEVHEKLQSANNQARTAVRAGRG